MYRRRPILSHIEFLRSCMPQILPLQSLVSIASLASAPLPSSRRHCSTGTLRHYTCTPLSNKTTATPGGDCHYREGPVSGRGAGPCARAPPWSRAGLAAARHAKSQLRPRSAGPPGPPTCPPPAGRRPRRPHWHQGLVLPQKPRQRPRCPAEQQRAGPWSSESPNVEFSSKRARIDRDLSLFVLSQVFGIAVKSRQSAGLAYIMIAEHDGKVPARCA